MFVARADVAEFDHTDADQPPLLHPRADLLRRSSARERPGPSTLRQRSPSALNHQLLHHLAGKRRLPGRLGGHSVGNPHFRRTPEELPRVSIHEQPSTPTLHSLDSFTRGSDRPPILGHTSILSTTAPGWPAGLSSSSSQSGYCPPSSACCP